MTTLLVDAPALRRHATPRDDVLVVLPEGTARPTQLPPEVFDAVARTYVGRRRLDMQELARELDVGRATLYRRVGSRDGLLGAVIWWGSRQTIARAVADTADLAGTARVISVVRQVLSAFHGNPALQHFLAAEPVAALRVLTSRSGGVQTGFVRALQRLLDLEVARGHLVLGVDSQTLAYVICRIGEGFLYADLIADRTPDVDAAVEVTTRLLVGSSRLGAGLT
jgi:AcrR family transcriptional regulator